ncbi:MAG: UDP-N-acetylmuramoyl-tripeptide--D-alanyl-D-alanine ligase [Myxococcota bacterium]
MATPIPKNRAAFTAQELQRAAGGAIVGRPVEGVVGVTTDSRAVVPGELFVALSGDRFDAHEFLPTAWDAGAAAAVVAESADIEVPADRWALVVADPLLALGAIARFHRLRWAASQKDPFVVAVTGSAGKTSTKELAAGALEHLTGPGALLKTAGNLNNRIGVPLTILGLDSSHRGALLELGTSEKGEIATLGAIARPTVACVIMASAAHTEGIGDLAAVVHEKSSLFFAAPETTVGVCRRDQPALFQRAEQAQLERLLGFGVDPEADIRLVESTIHSDGKTQVRFQINGREVAGALQMLGRGAGENAAAAIGIAMAVGVDPEVAIQKLEAVPPFAGRLAPRRLLSGGLLIDDSYNANPVSMALSLEVLRELAGGRPTIAVLGDMLELGDESADAHVEVGEQVVAARVDHFVACGPAMAEAAQRVRDKGGSVTEVADAGAALLDARAHLGPNTVVLVKGSRSLGLEAVSQALASENTAAENTAPREGGAQ